MFYSVFKKLQRKIDLEQVDLCFFLYHQLRSFKFLFWFLLWFYCYSSLPSVSLTSPLFCLCSSTFYLLSCFSVKSYYFSVYNLSFSYFLLYFDSWFPNMSGFTLSFAPASLVVVVFAWLLSPVLGSPPVSHPQSITCAYILTCFSTLSLSYLCVGYILVPRLDCLIIRLEESSLNLGFFVCSHILHLNRPHTKQCNFKSHLIVRCFKNCTRFVWDFLFGQLHLLCKLPNDMFVSFKIKTLI